MVMGILCSSIVSQAAKVSFSATGMLPHWGELTAQTSDGSAFTSGSEVADGTQLIFTAPSVVGYYVDWYVNETKDESATDQAFKLTVNGDVTVEARYVEAFKLVFEGTPFVKYADRNGYVYIGANFYHYTGPKNGAYGTSVSSWTVKGATNKTFNVDNVPNDTTFTRDTLKADLILTPTYVDNSGDLGDATATAVWSFAYPDSVPLFRQFKSTCHYVQPTNFNGSYTDVCMVIDASQGMLDNELRQGKGNTLVKAGTRFRLPVLYGSVYKLAGSSAFSATTINGEAPVLGTEGELHTATLDVTDPKKDSIDIVIGEDQYIKYISASYPGGHTTLTWGTNIKTEESTIGTASKAGEAGNVVWKMSDITNVGGLTVTPYLCDTLTSKIQATAEKDETKYMAVSFDVAEGFSFNLNSVTIPLATIVTGTTCKVEICIEDERGTKVDSIFSVAKSDSLTSFAMKGPKSTATTTNAIYLYGHITMKLFVYGADASYCLGTPISVAGVLCETITCGEGKTWALYVSKGALDMEKHIGLHVYEVVGVDEKQKTIIKVPLEEGRQATTVMINTEQPGAVFNTPLTRADDAVNTEDNRLHMSDGTAVGNKIRYRFVNEGELYYFQLVPEGEVIPEGEVYLEWDSFTYPEKLYKDKGDVPTGIREIDMNSLMATGETRRVIKNGQVLIVKPDGKVYNMAGARIY